MQIHVQLANIKKRDSSIADYFIKVKNIADTLATAGKQLQDEEIISYLLAGLNADYDPVVASLTTRSDVISLSDAFAYILSYEQRVKQRNVALQLDNNGANFVS